MPEKKLKDLYMGKTIKDLEQHYDLSKMSQRKTKIMCNTAYKLHLEAQQHQRDGDEEMCYIALMKFLGLVSKVQKAKDYIEHKPFINDLLGPKKVKAALDLAETVNASLLFRYKLKHESEESAQVEVSSVLEQDSKENASQPRSRLHDGNSAPDQVRSSQETFGSSITCMELYKLLAKSDKKIMIFDVRPPSDYNESHIKLAYTLNVPEDAVKKGMSAKKIETCLSDEAKKLYNTRGLVDLVVLMDWFSSGVDLPPDNKLSILSSILTEWDPGVTYNHKPIVLQGGYQEWLETYPTFTTNPNVVVPLLNSGDSFNNLLYKIEYVDLEDPVVRPASMASYVPESSQSVHMPVIDRSSKPHVLTVKSSGGGSVVDADRVSQPAVSNYKPDVLTSADEETGNAIVSDAPHTVNGSKKQLNDERGQGWLPGSGARTPVKLPVVDRTSKDQALSRYRQREATLLRDREEAADKSLQLTREQVKVEDEWEKVRAQKEQEADDELRVCLQEREEQLVQKILQLEHDRELMNEENEALRKDLESMRKEKEQVESISPVPSMEVTEIEQRIRNKEEAKNSLEEKRKADAEKRNRELVKARATKPSVASTKPAFVPLKDENTSGPSNQMKRSHSFPNLAQMVDDEAVIVKNRVPQYDRAIKPVEKAQAFEANAARQRSWQATYGRAGAGLIGLKNLGNSCYMNSIIQCISNTTSLAFYFVEGQHRNDINKSSKTSGSVVEEVAAVVRKLWSGQCRSFAAYDLKTVLGQLKSSFKGTEQQDSHEFLTLVMDWLHEELNKKSGMSPKVSKTLSKLPADVEWEKFCSNNDSIIQSLFFGQQTSTVTCCTCSKQSVTYEPFSTISLPLPSSASKCTLQECVRLYLREETLSGWNCPSCKESRDAVKKFDILRLPQILVLHLKRFHHDGWSRKKQMMVDFPLCDLNMKEFTLHPRQAHTVYNLYAVSNHYGTMEGGHYTAFCHNHAYGKWAKFDDQEVSDLSPADVKTMAAYILFYVSTNSNVGGLREFDK